MTEIAVVRKNRPHIAIEFNLLWNSVVVIRSVCPRATNVSLHNDGGQKQTSLEESASHK
jgi:hypothetical protein